MVTTAFTAPLRAGKEPRDISRERRRLEVTTARLKLASRRRAREASTLGKASIHYIDSLPKEQHEKAYEQVAWLWATRLQGTNSEKLANKALFPNVEAMDVNLQNWGL